MFTHELTSPTSAVVYTINYMEAIMIIPRWIQLPDFTLTIRILISTPDWISTELFHITI